MTEIPQPVIAVSYVLNWLTFGPNGATLCSRAYHAEQEGYRSGKIFRPILDWIFSPLETTHCRKAYIKWKLTILKNQRSCSQTEPQA